MFESLQRLEDALAQRPQDLAAMKRAQRQLRRQLGMLLAALPGDAGDDQDDRQAIEEDRGTTQAGRAHAPPGPVSPQHEKPPAEMTRGRERLLDAVNPPVPFPSEREPEAVAWILKAKPPQIRQAGEKIKQELGEIERLLARSADGTGGDVEALRKRTRTIRELLQSLGSASPQRRPEPTDVQPEGPRQRP